MLCRARELGSHVLVSANALSRWTKRRGWREWAGWSTRQLVNAAGLHSFCLDSADLTAMMAYGGFSWSARDYVGYPFRWWASLDCCVEQEIARDREEILDRISRTVRANIDCRLLGEDEGIGATFLPVIQGRSPADYECCADALSDTISRAQLVGMGSMCQRPIHGAQGLIAVLDHLDRILPRDIRLHWWEHPN